MMYMYQEYFIENHFCVCIFFILFHFRSFIFFSIFNIFSCLIHRKMAKGKSSYIKECVLKYPSLAGRHLFCCLPKYPTISVLIKLLPNVNFLSSDEIQYTSINSWAEKEYVPLCQAENDNILIKEIHSKRDFF